MVRGARLWEVPAWNTPSSLSPTVDGGGYLLLGPRPGHGCISPAQAACLVPSCTLHRSGRVRAGVPCLAQERHADKEGAAGIYLKNITRLLSCLPGGWFIQKPRRKYNQSEKKLKKKNNKGGAKPSSTTRQPGRQPASTSARVAGDQAPQPVGQGSQSATSSLREQGRRQRRCWVNIYLYNKSVS